MDLLGKLEMLNNNLTELKHDLGDQWEVFKEKFLTAHSRLKAGDLQEAEDGLNTLFDGLQDANLLPDRARHKRQAVRTRGFLAPEPQSSGRESNQREPMVFQRSLYDLADKILRSIHVLDEGSVKKPKKSEKPKEPDKVEVEEGGGFLGLRRVVKKTWFKKKNSPDDSR